MAMQGYSFDAPLAYGYCRKSTSEQREESIEAQQRAIIAYAAACGYKLVKIYKDHGNSGRNGERPQFMQMVQDAAAGGAQYIIVHKLDRFFRNAERQTLVEVQLRRHGVRVLSATEHFDDSPQGQFMRNITKAINQWYSANLAQEVMKGLRENAINARNTGGPPPLGYAVDKATGKFVIEPREAEAVRIIFRMYLQDAGYAAIIDELNRGGYTTRRGRPFGKNSIYEILRNEKYTGVYIWNKLAPADPDGHVSRRRLKPRSEWVYVENGMPRIIDPEDFRRAQAEMEKRRHKSGQARAKVFYLLSGLVYCGGCGGAMGGEVRRYKSHGNMPVEYRYYVCTTKKRLHGAGEHVRAVPADQLERAVLDYIQHVVLHPATMERLCLAVLDSMRQGDSPADKAEDLQKQAARIQKKIDRLYEAIENGLDGPDTIQRIKDLQKQRTGLLAEAADLERETDGTAATVDQLCRVWGSIRLDGLPPEQLRTLIRTLIEKIIVYDDGPNTHRVRIVLNPGKVKPGNLPAGLAEAPLQALGKLFDTAVDGLPLPRKAAYPGFRCAAFCVDMAKRGRSAAARHRERRRAQKQAPEGPPPVRPFRGFAGICDGRAPRVTGRWRRNIPAGGRGTAPRRAAPPGWPQSRRRRTAPRRPRGRPVSARRRSRRSKSCCRKSSAPSFARRFRGRGSPFPGRSGWRRPPA